MPLLCGIYIYSTVFKEANRSTRYDVENELNEAYGDSGIPKDQKDTKVNKFEAQKRKVQSPKFQKKAEQPLKGAVPSPVTSNLRSSNSSLSQYSQNRISTAYAQPNPLKN